MISILYVDDEQLLLEICKLYLERSKNIQVTTAVSAKKGLELLATEHFDGIISDYQMPGMDGIEFLKNVRKENKTIPFIIFTGRGREEIVIEALKEGADFYLQKGGDPSAQFAELRNHIEQIVRQRKAEADLINSETLYRTLFETAQDAIFLMDNERIIECNHRTKDLFSADVDQIIGKTPLDFSPEFQQDGRLSEEKARHLILSALSGEPQFFEWKVQRTDAVLIDVEVNMNRIEVKGRYLLLSIIRDVSERNRILNELEKKTEDLGASYEEILATEEELRNQYSALSQSEQALKASEEKLRSTLASMDDLVLTLDEKGVFLDAYREEAGQYYIPPDELIGHHYREVLPPHLADLLGCAIDSVISTGKTEQVTYSMLLNGEIRFFNAKISVRHDGKGEIAGVTLVARDITDDRMNQKALLEIKSLLEEVIQGNPIPQFIINKNHEVTHWNASLAAYSHIPPEDVIGTNRHWRAFYPDERPCLADLLVDEQFEMVGEWYKGKYALSRLVKEAFEAVDFFPQMGESGIWLYFTAAVIRNKQGEIIGAVETLEDITDQKEAMRRLKHEEVILNAVIQESPVPAFVIDNNHRLMFWNQALSLYSGISGTDVIGSSQHWRAFYPDERPCLADLLVDNATGDLKRWYGEKYSPSNLIPGAYEAIDFFPALGKDGRWLYFTAAPIRSEDGEVVGAVEILQDITGQKNAQKELLTVSQYLESIIDNAHVWLMVLGLDTTVLIWNKAAEEISGYASEEVVGSKDIWKVLYPDPAYRKEVSEKILQIIRENRYVTNFHTLVHDRSGNIHQITWNTKALVNETGDVTSYVAVGVEYSQGV